MIVRANVRPECPGVRIQIEIELTWMNDGCIDHCARCHVANALTIGREETRVVRLFNDHKGYLRQSTITVDL